MMSPANVWQAQGLKMGPRPRLFIGCSSEGLNIARAIQSSLYYDAEPIIWSEGVFGLSGGTLDSLLRCVSDFDFAVFALTADDLLEKRGVTGNAPRDNVLFELGLFMGRLGRERTFFVICRDDGVHLPTDLAGVTPALFIAPSESRFLQSALAVATTPILAAIRTLGRRGEAQANATSLADELDQLRHQVSEMRIMLADLFASVAQQRPILNKRVGKPRSLEFLRGTWVGDPTGSTAWCTIIDGVAVFSYCYGGDDHPTGIYYGWRLKGNTISGKFRWLYDPNIYGYAWFEIQDERHLSGGWWMHTQVQPSQEHKLPYVPDMVPLRWDKKSDSVPKRMVQVNAKLLLAQLEEEKP